MGQAENEFHDSRVVKTVRGLQRQYSASRSSLSRRETDFEQQENRGIVPLQNQNFRNLQARTNSQAQGNLVVNTNGIAGVIPHNLMQS